VEHKCISARALDTLRGNGETVADTLLAHLAPIGWQHINLTGDYTWHANKRVAKGGFRPLRSPRNPSGAP